MLPTSRAAGVGRGREGSRARSSATRIRPAGPEDLKASVCSWTRCRRDTAWPSSSGSSTNANEMRLPIAVRSSSVRTLTGTIAFSGRTRLAAGQRERPQSPGDRRQAGIVEGHARMRASAGAGRRCARDGRPACGAGRSTRSGTRAGRAAGGRPRPPARRADRLADAAPARGVARPVAGAPATRAACPAAQRGEREADGAGRGGRHPVRREASAARPGSASKSSRPSSTADLPSTSAWCILNTRPMLPVLEPRKEVEVPQRAVAQQRLGERVAGHRHEAVVRDGLVLRREPASRVRARGSGGRPPSRARPCRAGGTRAAGGSGARTAAAPRSPSAICSSVGRGRSP